jgi:hypothetical protein
MEELTKKCAKCGQFKPITAFNKSTRMRDGLQSYCRICATESAKQAYRKTRTILTGDDSNPLAKYRPRDLIDELKRRGFHGELALTQTVKF